MPVRFARIVVLVAGAVILVVETLATRLVAPSGRTTRGNVVLVAADRPLDLPALRERLAVLGEPAVVLDEAATRALAGAARPLTDDHAPADQLITPYRYS